MPYCNFNSDNFKSDVFVWLSNDGLALRVARNRITSRIPEVPPFPFGGTEAEFDTYFAAHERQMSALNRAKRQPIGGPHDGKSWVFETLEELRDKLRELAAVGYRVPASAFEAIDRDLEGANG